MTSRIGSRIKDLRNRIDVWWWYNHHRVLGPAKHAASILIAVLSVPLWPLTLLALWPLRGLNIPYRFRERISLGIGWGTLLYCALAGYYVGHLLVSYLVG